ncbi:MULTISPECIES: MotA/TolQ/ExbB proton channel family protein [unclassified Psychrobacter]|uniref:MotA/TolQ/ExbB proton channel family protein n=1 Tax=unclassified Psychrobacter TaxID=196806 RepID=UPI00071E8A21|nr:MULTISPECIES: MotA/TolQ/ExbB proton channel family protein [unclassified Psychrobacter]OLF39175.1 biopolymer transporter ExbB [Psychrobacter sp. Cmf 22.2]
MDFMHYWQISDMVTKTLFFLLLILSIISWVTGIIRVLQSRKLATTVADDLSQQMMVKQPELDGCDAAQRRLVTEQTLLKHIGRYRFASERGLPILGTTAAIAPFIGLFGTVWGIFHALHNIGMTGQAGLGQVAGPVGEALIMTGLGIAVAIPAVVFYNLSVRINRRVMYHANDRAHDLLATSAKQAVANSHPSTVPAAQVAKDKQVTQKDAQHTAHYRNSAPSQG